LTIVKSMRSDRRLSKYGKKSMNEELGGSRVVGKGDDEKKGRKKLKKRAKKIVVTKTWVRRG